MSIVINGMSFPAVYPVSPITLTPDMVVQVQEATTADPILAMECVVWFDGYEMGCSLSRIRQAGEAIAKYVNEAKR